MELKDKNSQQEKSKYKLHTKSPLCKKWQENTSKKLETLKIIKLSKKNLINLLKQTNKKPNLEEKIQIMSMLCLLLDSSIPLSTKKMFIEGAKNISPMVNFFKKTFLNFINKKNQQNIIIQENIKINDKIKGKKGILNWTIEDFFNKLITKAIDQTKKIFYNILNNNQIKNLNDKNVIIKNDKIEVKTNKEKDNTIRLNKSNEKIDKKFELNEKKEKNISIKVKETINEKRIKFENNYTKENKKTSYWVKKIEKTKDNTKSIVNHR